MNSFSIKDLLLHILHGACVVGAIILAFLEYKEINTFEKIIVFSNQLGSVGITALSLLFIGISYLFGLFLDAAMDMLEGITLNCRKKISPAYCFLFKNGKYMKLELAHWKKIKDELYNKAKENDPDNEDFKIIELEINKDAPGREKNILKAKERVSFYLFQCAKSKAFRVASTYQVNHIESFYRLYIFFRNLILTTLVSVLILLLKCPDIFWNWTTVIVALLIIGFSFIASLRFFGYYARIILGTAYSPALGNQNQTI